MVGNNTPVFFIRDPLKFGDFIHTQKRDPQTNLKSPTMMWDFWSLSPESLHQVTILFSDRGTPYGYRHMNGYSSHTYSLINSNNQLFYVKWHFKTKQGIQNFTREQADEMRGKDPDYAQRDLFNAIAKGEFPKWRVCIQLMPEKEAETYNINPFDLTKVWPHKDYPLVEVGELVLDRNPVNYFAEVEQAAFEPKNIVPGMGFSPDKEKTMRQREIIRTTLGELIVAVADEVIPLTRDPSGLYRVVSYVVNDVLARRHLRVHKRSRRKYPSYFSEN